MSSIVQAQTWTACNPLEKSCPENPALAGTYQWKYGGPAPDFNVTACPDLIRYDHSDYATFRVEKSQDAPTIASNFYIMWGAVEITMKPAPGAGVVSSLVLQSDDLDEIDWEWIGAAPNEVQSNYFGKGITGNYDRGATHTVDGQAQWNTYGLVWTQEKTDWTINGNVVRTLTFDQAGDQYPQTPMQVRQGSWAAGDPKNSEGTIQWSKGPTDYGKGPFDMLVKEIKVIDYSTGTAYKYTDKSGSWQSIQSVGGKIGAGPQTGEGNQGKIPAPPILSSKSTKNMPGTKTGLLIQPSGSASATRKGKYLAKRNWPHHHDMQQKKTGADSKESTRQPY